MADPGNGPPNANPNPSPNPTPDLNDLPITRSELPLIYECTTVDEFRSTFSQLIAFSTSTLIPEFLQADFLLTPSVMFTLSSSLLNPSTSIPATKDQDDDTPPSPATSTSPSVAAALSQPQEPQEQHQQFTTTSIPVSDALTNQPAGKPSPVQKAIARAVFSIVGKIDGFGWTTRNTTRNRDGWRLQYTCTDSRLNSHRSANRHIPVVKRGRKPKIWRSSGVGFADGGGGGGGGNSDHSHMAGEGQAGDTQEVPAEPGSEDGERIRGGGGEGGTPGEAGAEGKGEGDEAAKSGSSTLPTYDCAGTITCLFSSQRNRLIVSYTHIPVHRTVAERKALNRARIRIYRLPKATTRKTKYGVPVAGWDGNGNEGLVWQGGGAANGRGGRSLGEPRAIGFIEPGGEVFDDVDAEGEVEEEEVGETDAGMQLLREWNSSVQHEGIGATGEVEIG